MDLAIIAAVFPVIFIGELPDKSMFASLVMASRGRPFVVWLGTALAFLVHVVIAVSIGVSLFRILPQAVVDVVVAILFGVSAVVAFIAAFDAEERQQEIVTEYRAHRVFVTAFLVIFVAEWGDLTQVLTANFAVRYGSGVSVAVGATLALWTVSGLAVLGGYGLLARLPARGLRLATGSVLAVLSVLALVAAFR